MIRLKGCRQFNRNSTIWENQHVENQGRQKEWVASKQVAKGNGLPKQMGSEWVAKANRSPKLMVRQKEWVASKKVAKGNGLPKRTGRQS
jgi:hypothetical protein